MSFKVAQPHLVPSACLREALSADLADVRFLSRVYPLVGLHVALLDEGLAAEPEVSIVGFL